MVRGRHPVLLLLALGLGLGCPGAGTEDVTGVALTVRFADTLNVEQLRVLLSFGAEQPFDPVLLPEEARALDGAGERAELLLPDDYAGQTLTVEVEGLEAEAVVARGQGEIALVEGELVELAVELLAEAQQGVCGDGRRDVGEGCDDDDLDDGDGCSASCQIEDGWSCDTVLEPSVCTPDGGCGDGALDAGEDCDDDNDDNDDGCSATCEIEDGWSCDTAGEPSVCQRCGDGVLQGDEGCDDGDTEPGDGCDSTCAMEAGWVCGGEPSVCARTCGNGSVDAGETCDDGNRRSGDGCSAQCALETGFICPMADSACEPICGDGLLVGGEGCDDGGTVPGDGCDAACEQESGWSCDTTVEPSVCQRCGDGALQGTESCDDGDLDPGDGCDEVCAMEPGWVCSGEPSSCAFTCGNSTLDSGETCDDGDLSSGDGCSTGCQTEAGFSCPTVGEDCAAICGDGMTRGAEGCDDGDTDAGDGCDAACQVETDWSCDTSVEPSVCRRCGNGLVEGGEVCDDGGVATGDGCDETCAVEPGYACSGAPSVCVLSCGDGDLDGGEACDDGDLDPGDGCDDTCTVEPGFDCLVAGAACLPICGDGLLRGAEACDDGDTDPADGCDETCAVELGYTCADEPSVCVVGCVIAGLPVAEGALDPNNPCASCQTDVSDSAYSARADGTPCPDSDWCDGVETCQGGVCTHGSAQCTDDPYYPSCNGPAQACVCMLDSCDDGTFCNGAESCDVAGLCQPGADPCPDQGCDEVEGCLQCQNDGDCPLCEWCDGGSCAPQASGQDLKTECADAAPCLTGSCDGDSACGLLDAGTDCGTCRACNSSGGCVDALSQDGDCGTCEECDAGGTCVNQQAGHDAKGECDNDLYCDGLESCDGQGSCQAGVDPCPGLDCDDGIDECTGCTCSGEEICWPTCGDPATGCVTPNSAMTLACQDPVSLASTATSTCTLGLVGGDTTGQADCLSCSAELGVARLYTSAFDNGAGGCQLDGWQFTRSSPGNHCQDRASNCSYGGQNQPCCDELTTVCDTTTFGAPVLKSDRASNCGGGDKQWRLERSFNLAGITSPYVCVEVADVGADMDEGVLIHVRDSLHIIGELVLCLNQEHEVRPDGAFFTYCGELPAWAEDNPSVAMTVGVHSNDNGDILYLRRLYLEGLTGGCAGESSYAFTDDFAGCDLGQWSVTSGTPGCSFECWEQGGGTTATGVTAAASSFSIETTVDTSQLDGEVTVIFYTASETADPGGGDELTLRYNAGGGWQSAFELSGPIGGGGDCLEVWVNLSDLDPRANNNPALGIGFDLTAVSSIGVYGVAVTGVEFCAADAAVVSVGSASESGGGLYNVNVTDASGEPLVTRVQCAWDPDSDIGAQDSVRFTP